MFACPSCKKAALDITAAIDLGPDDYSDEVSLQVLRCRCGAAYLGEYEESRRGSDSRFHHRGHNASKESIAKVEALIAACPTERRNDHCTCPSHTALANGAHRAFFAGDSFALTR